MTIAVLFLAILGGVLALGAFLGLLIQSRPLEGWLSWLAKATLTKNDIRSTFHDLKTDAGVEVGLEQFFEQASPIPANNLELDYKPVKLFEHALASAKVRND